MYGPSVDINVGLMSMVRIDRLECGDDEPPIIFQFENEIYTPGLIPRRLHQLTAIFPSVLVLFRIFRTENKEYKYFIQNHDSSSGNANQSSLLFVDLIQIDTCDVDIICGCHQNVLWMKRIPIQILSTVKKTEQLVSVTVTKGTIWQHLKEHQIGRLRKFVFNFNSKPLKK